MGGWGRYNQGMGALSGAALAGPVHLERSGPLTIDANKTVARRFIGAVWNRGDLELAGELLDEHLVNHDADGTTTDKRQFLQFIAEFRAAFPDLHFAIEDMLAEGDRVATRVTIRGTQAGPFQGVAATGRPTTWTGIGIIRVRGGKIVEQWADTDTVRAAVQAGLRPVQP